MKMILLALLTACLPPWNGSSNCFPEPQALGGLTQGRAKTWGFDSRKECHSFFEKLNDSEEEEGEEEEIDGVVHSLERNGPTSSLRNQEASM